MSPGPGFCCEYCPLRGWLPPQDFMSPMSFSFWGVPWDVSRGMVNSLGDAARCSVSVAAARRTGDYPRLYLPAAGGTPSSAGCHLFFPALERQNFHFRSVPSSLCSVLAEAELRPRLSAHARSIPAKCSLCPSAPNRCPRPPSETLNKYIFCSAQPRQSERLFKNQEEKMPRQQCP